MIAHLRGAVEFIGKDHLIVNVGNVGLRVYVPSATRDTTSIGRVIDLFTHLHIRENDWTLYGFTSQDELDLFELLLSVSGVGARTALAVLAAAARSTPRGDRARAGRGVDARARHRPENRQEHRLPSQRQSRHRHARCRDRVSI